MVSYDVGFAQDAKAQTKADSTKVIAVVPLANIGTETETTLVKIREIKDKIKPTSTELQLDTLIPQKLKIVEKLKKDLDLEGIGKMNLRQAEGLKNDINQMHIQLDGWRNSLMKKTEETNVMKVDLGDIKKNMG